VTGPLAGVRVLEIAGIGPGPFAGMMLADMGADVIRVDRIVKGAPPRPYATEILVRGRRSVSVDLKNPAGAEVVRRLSDSSDVVFEGFRPGVVERLGIGPEVLCESNPRLVYGRMTGFGREGVWGQRAGHDIDYIALSGGLHPIGKADQPPPPPLNFVADFGGGGMFLAFGIVCALMERERSGLGQVVDAAMIDGVGILSAMFHGRLAAGAWSPERENNVIDGASPYYRCYTCSDGEFVAVGAIEPQFFAELLDVVGLNAADWRQNDQAQWPELIAALEAAFASRTRDDWADIFEKSDACAAPVLSLAEAPKHPHMVAREAYLEADGITQPAPAPRFSRTKPTLGRPPAVPGAYSAEVLAESGFGAAEIDNLVAAGTVA
jgi:alpha-methylacyl-CoA racemase